MDTYTALVEEFKTFAQKKIDEQTQAIQKKYDREKEVNRSERLKIFNEHFNTLKSQLEKHKMQLESKLGANVLINKAKLEKDITVLYNECINEFLKKDFNVNI